MGVLSDTVSVLQANDTVSEIVLISLPCLGV